MLYAELAVNAALTTTLTYHVPPELEGRIQPGHLVTAPLRDGRAYAVVVALRADSPVAETRPLGEPVDPEPVVSPAQLELARWLSARTLAPLMDCLRLMLPPGLARRADVLVELVDPPPPHKPRARPPSKTQQAVLDALAARGALRGRQIARLTGTLDWRNVVGQLVARGLVRKHSLLPPPAVRPKQARVVHLTATSAQIAGALEELDLLPRGPLYRAILDLLLGEDEGLEASWVYAQTGCTLAHLRRLEEMGLVSFEEEEVWRDPLGGQVFVPSEPLALTNDQARADERIRAAIRDAAPPVRPALPERGLEPGTVFLLHGVTGSGKTEIYLQAVAEALQHERSALVLVPEIALTPQTVRRFAARFPGRVAVVHSLLGLGERYDTWRRIRSGDLRVIVGTRSALFAPLRDLGVIVLDEEHDASYKQSPEESGAPFMFPPYHGRDVALALGRLSGAPVVLGSATPDLGTYYHAQRGTYTLLALPRRILGHQQRLAELARQTGVRLTRYRPLDSGPVQARYAELPPVEIVDLRSELKAGNRSIFSRALQAALQEALAHGEQAILFLNRRGQATFVMCRDCGHVIHCKHCDTPMTYHRAASAQPPVGTPARHQPRLVCHTCNAHQSLPAACPECRGKQIRYFGLGTEQVEEAVRAMFPDARTLRWDRDTARTPEAHAAILQRFMAGQADVLVGTQMIAKGLDLPLVTVVGVISADTALFLPDYRAGERTFQLLTQVAGRAGRGLLGGKVVLQTYNPEHYAIQAAAQHDYETFYQQELAYRREHQYPPFRRIARLLWLDGDARRAEESARALARQIERAIRRHALGLTDLLGPAPCFFARIADRFRWQILVRSPDPLNVLSKIEVPEGWLVDVDPASIL
jgi:primosomal protein N' (replication factor Y)